MLFMDSSNSSLVYGFGLGEGKAEEKGEGSIRAMTITAARSLDEGPPTNVSVIFPAGALGVHAIGSTSPTFQVDWFVGAEKTSKPDVWARAAVANARN